jgi:acyl dehydratase
MKTIAYSQLSELAGQEIGVSDWLEITQSRVNAFAETTGDNQWIHVDVERAQREIGGPIAHGWLLASLIPLLNRGLMRIEGVSRAINYGSDKIRFVTPVRVGVRLRQRLHLQAAQPKSGGTEVKWGCRLELEHETKPACAAEIITLYFPA